MIMRGSRIDPRLSLDCSLARSFKAMKSKMFRRYFDKTRTCIGARGGFFTGLITLDHSSCTIRVGKHPHLAKTFRPAS